MAAQRDTRAWHNQVTADLESRFGSNPESREDTSCEYTYSAPMPVWASGESHKITKDMYMPWVAWARTMDNGLDTVLTEAVGRGIAMYDFYAGARDATWTDCVANESQGFYTAQVPAWCVDQCAVDNSDDVYGESAGRDSRDAALAALEAWKVAVRGGERTPEAIAAIDSAADEANELALEHQAISGNVWSPNPRYGNIWNYALSETAIPMSYRFQESWDIEPGHPELSHFDRSYLFHEWYISVSVFMFIADYGSPYQAPPPVYNDTCWYRENFDFTTSPDGTLILLEDTSIVKLLTRKLTNLGEPGGCQDINCSSLVDNGSTMFWLRGSQGSTGPLPTPDPGPPLVDCRLVGSPGWDWEA